MIAEQTTSSAYWISDQHPAIEIKITIRMELPAGDPYHDVSIALLFEPELPVHLQDLFHECLYGGVHGGLAATGFSLPSEGIKVEILTLDILPPLDTIITKEDIVRFGQALQALTMGTVAALRAGLEHLSGGRNTRMPTPS